MFLTLSQLQEKLNNLIEKEGGDSYCGAWIYTADDCAITGLNGDHEYPCDEHPELSERIFADVGNNDYIYQVIQEVVDESTEEQYMIYQQELV